MKTVTTFLLLALFGSRGVEKRIRSSMFSYDFLTTKNSSWK